LDAELHRQGKALTADLDQGRFAEAHGRLPHLCAQFDFFWVSANARATLKDQWERSRTRLTELRRVLDERGPR
jgi:hypothetical protein